MKKILLLLLFCASFLPAEINEYVSDVYFANGIDTSKKQAHKSLTDINDSIRIKYPEAHKSVKNWQVSYNHTHGIGIDLYESSSFPSVLGGNAYENIKSPKLLYLY